MSKVGIVIPTIFERPGYLFEAIISIRAAGSAHILLSTPDNPEMISRFINIVDEHQIEKPTGNLASKINHSLGQLPSECEFIGWLGDDDLLTPKSLERAVSALQENPEIALVYGSCDYINAKGEKIGQNPSGNWAKSLMHFGPFLIPQPGSVWRRSAFEQIDGIDDSFDLAFDHDLFIRLKKHSGALFLDNTQAAFRWHSESLSVGRRWQSATEASKVREKHYNKLLLPIMLLWEPLVVVATKLAFPSRRTTPSVIATFGSSTTTEYLSKTSFSMLICVPGSVNS
jgi:hypothetical protein